MSQILGLTGGIGSGKSTVAKILAELGAKIIDADLLARTAVEAGSPGLAKILDRFGAQLLAEDGELDRKALAAFVFSDTQARDDLNAIVHPEVARLAVEAMQILINESVPVIIYDVPLLYENGLEKSLPKVIVVHVPPDIQRERIRQRDGFDPAEIEARIAAQDDLDEKARKADYLIDNRGTASETRNQVETLWDTLSGLHE